MLNFESTVIILLPNSHLIFSVLVNSNKIKYNKNKNTKKLKIYIK